MSVVSSCADAQSVDSEGVNFEVAALAPRGPEKPPRRGPREELKRAAPVAEPRADRGKFDVDAAAAAAVGAGAGETASVDM